MANFTTDVFKSIIWTYEPQADGSTKKVDSGRTVDSKFLFDLNGNPVIDPTSITASYPTGRPYIIPADMDFNANVKSFADQSHTPMEVEQILLYFTTEGILDLQRVGINGSYEGFVSDYTPAASLYFGAVSAALTVPANIAEIGGGVLNYVNFLKDGVANTNGEYWNNPINVDNIRKGQSYYQSYISTSPILDIFVKAFDLWADLTYYAFHTKDVDLSEEFADTIFSTIAKQADTVTSWTQTLSNISVNLLNNVKELSFDTSLEGADLSEADLQNIISAIDTIAPPTDTTTIDNSKLDLNIHITDPLYKYSGGLLIGDSDWEAVMPDSVLNSDGWLNTDISRIASDNFRPSAKNAA